MSTGINKSISTVWKSFYWYFNYLICTFQRHNFLSDTAQMYGKRWCHAIPPYVFKGDSISGTVDLPTKTFNVRSGRPMVAMAISVLPGAKRTIRPPSSCTCFMSAGANGRLKSQVTMSPPAKAVTKSRLLFAQSADISGNLGDSTETTVCLLRTLYRWIMPKSKYDNSDCDSNW